MAATKKQWYETLTEQEISQGDVYATSGNDLFTIPDSWANVEIVSKGNKGTDAIKFTGITTLDQIKSSLSFSQGKNQDGTYNRDLIIFREGTDQTVTIKDYFKKVDGKATSSPVKYIALSDAEFVSIVDNCLIDYRDDIVMTKKGSVTGSNFNDKIVG